LFGKEIVVGRFIERHNLKKICASLRESKQIVFTNGCFDLLHVGHVRYLQEAKKQGHILIVGVNTDASVKRLKGPLRPIQIEGDRGEILAALECVDYVTLFDEDTPLNLIKEIMPHILVKGGDWKPDQIVGSDLVLASGGKVLSLNFVEGRSTTSIIQQIDNEKKEF
jgi:D-beta-D-heptose 7-phosphate kinase/D-beta-D-heptose 1-phosphate adenosyltransferase